MDFAAALSEHPVAAEAAGQVIGEIIERVGAEPGLALLVVSRHHLPAFADIAGAIRNVVRPATLAGVTASAVVGGAREIERQPAIALWAARLGPGRPVRLVTERFGGDAPVAVGWPDPPIESAAAIVLSDPFTFDAEAALDALARRQPGLRAIGGMASAATQPGGNRLVLDDRVYEDGGVAVLLPPDAAVDAVVSQGCRPVGDPLVVTRAEGQLVQELAGQPALERLTAMVETLSAADRELLARGLHIGRVIDEHKADFGRGDFLVRAVLGADRESGAIAIGDEPRVGSTMQFQVRDAASADEDLRALLANLSGRGALLFTCNGRGTDMFGEPDHDASVLAARVSGPAVAGMSCAGEIGPVGPENFVHGYTASALVFR